MSGVAQSPAATPDEQDRSTDRRIRSPSRGLSLLRPLSVADVSSPCLLRPSGRRVQTGLWLVRVARLCFGGCMNHCFRLIYNRISNRWVVASELARRQGKATSGSRTVRRALVVAGVGLAGILGAGEVAAACKSPLQWTEQGLLIPGIANMSRTPDAGFSIKIDNSNRSAPNGRDAENMGPLWLDHYCERSPAVPANQNLTVYARGMNGGVGNSGGFATSGGAGGRGGDGSNIFVGLLSDDGLISVNGVAALLAHSRGGNGGDGGSAGAIAGSGGRGGAGRQRRRDFSAQCRHAENDRQRCDCHVRAQRRWLRRPRG